jgi:ABC-2 type transport system permease protein
MLVVATFIAVTAGITIAIFSANEPTAAEFERGERRYERQLTACLAGEFGTPEQNGFGGTVAEMCAEMVRPEFFRPNVVSWTDANEIVLGAAFMVLLLGAVLGATLGGADWSTGTMSTLLTWESRRLHIMLARALVVAAVVVVMSVYAQALLLAGFAALVAVRGSFGGTPAGFARDLAATVVRIGGVAAVFGLMGLSLATIGRSTVAGLGVLLGYLIVVEGFLSNLVFWVQKVTFGRSASVAVTDEAAELVDVSAIPPVSWILTPGRGWLNLVVWAGALVAVAAAVFRARDVT